MATSGGWSRWTCLVGLLLAPTFAVPVRAEFLFTVFSVLGAGSTSARDISNDGLAIGDYLDAQNRRHGFLRDAAGGFTFFDIPGLDTLGEGINSAHSVVGAVRDSSSLAFRGYVRAADGSFTAFDAPGSNMQAGAGTFAQGINELGQVVGFFYDAALQTHGFIRALDGSISGFDIAGSTGTILGGINDAGQITGTFTDAALRGHGFLRQADGSLTIFDVPGSTGTFGIDINALGQVTGTFLDSLQVVHGFLRQPDGSFVIIDAHGSPQTQPQGINDLGQLAGDLSGNPAFIATPAEIAEPNSAALIGAALLAFAGWRRWRRS